MRKSNGSFKVIKLFFSVEETQNDDSVEEDSEGCDIDLTMTEADKYKAAAKKYKKKVVHLTSQVARKTNEIEQLRELEERYTKQIDELAGEISQIESQ